MLLKLIGKPFIIVKAIDLEEIMSKNLVIVESPAKANTIKKFLGNGFTVMASFGHVRDLPEKAFGIDVENHYQPSYEILSGKKEVVDRLKKAVKESDRTYLATDPDREGEAISYHLAHLLKIDPQSKCRIVFNEITKPAVTNALNETRPIDMDMFYAQQARRILDRIVGYKTSPLLWKKIKKGLSAGRVQSVALELICDREEEIRAFVPEEYWNLMLKLSKISDDQIFMAKFYGKDNEKVKLSNEAEANEVYKYVSNNIVSVKSVKKTKRKKYPFPPFITSTLQQDASNKLGFTTSKTMKIAQELYEGVELKNEGSVGLITYMRTDSTRISADFQMATRDFIKQNFGSEFLPSNIPSYKNRNNTQDAHEAIRPTDFNLTPTRVSASLTKDQASLYTLIYNRYIASQMAPAEYDNTAVDIVCGPYLFKAVGNIVTFKGYMTVYEEHRIEQSDSEKDEYENTYLPKLSAKEQLMKHDLQKIQKFTTPPSRYTEASLVKIMEEKGIGRPSTYAPTINIILKRNYVKREKRILVPTDLGMTVNSFMVKNFETLLDYGFTAQMEEKLDNIETGKVDWISLIDKFYKDYIEQIYIADLRTDKIDLPSDEVCEKCGKPMLIKSGRYGDFLGCSGYPACNFTKKIIDDTGYKCPKCNGKVLNKKTKSGVKFISCENYPKCDFSSWGTIIKDRKCPKCDSFLLKVFEDKQAMTKCSSDKCDYKTKFVSVTKRKKEK